MRYRITINTDSYKCSKCSKDNWEPGTRNDYMLAINERTFTENSLKEVGWLLDMFQGNTFNIGEWTPENSDKVGKYGEYYGMSEKYYKWLHKKGHIVKYYDNICNLNRQQWLSGYGFCQGYLDKRKHFEELKKSGITKVFFKELYDVRQYDKNLNGCYMEIKSI